MTVRIAINGFGRIGRLVLRAVLIRFRLFEILFSFSFCSRRDL